MRGARGRRIATATDQDPGQAIRFAVVTLCLLGTAVVYAACIVLVIGGHLDVLFGALPWLAATAAGTMLVVTASAVLSAGQERLKNRRRLTVERIRELAAEIHSLEPAQRGRAKKQLIERLDITRDALAEIIQLDPAVRDQLLSAGMAGRVERELSASRGKWHRVSAAGVLGLLRAETSVAALKRALDDADADVAYAAAQALACYSSPDAYAALLFALTKQRLPAARVASLLEAFRCPTARELIERRADSENPTVRYWVAYLLGSLADPRSTETIERLAHDPEEDVRANAAESLASFPNEPLLLALLNDESWVVRSHAAKAAGVTGLKGLAPRLGELLEDRSWWVRQNATLSLAALGEAAVPVLLEQLRSSDRFARNKSAEALIRCGYVARQIDCLALDRPGAEDAHSFLVAVGRAEALSTIEHAAQTMGQPEGRERLLGVLEEVRRAEANEVSPASAVAA